MEKSNEVIQIEIQLLENNTTIKDGGFMLDYRLTMICGFVEKYFRIY